MREESSFALSTYLYGLAIIVRMYLRVPVRYVCVCMCVYVCVCVCMYVYVCVC